MRYMLVSGIFRDSGIRTPVEISREKREKTCTNLGKFSSYHDRKALKLSHILFATYVRCPGSFTDQKKNHALKIDLYLR